jgi:hypothetical protein
MDREQSEEKRHHQAHPGKGKLLPEATQCTVGKVGNTVEHDKEQASPSKPACAPLCSRCMRGELDTDRADQDNKLVPPGPGISNHLTLREIAIEEIGDLEQDRKVGSQGDASPKLQNPGFRCLDLYGVAPQPAEADGQTAQDVPQRPDVVMVAAASLHTTLRDGGGRGGVCISATGCCVRGVSVSGSCAHLKPPACLCVAFGNQAGYTGPATPINFAVSWWSYP